MDDGCGILFLIHSHELINWVGLIIVAALE